MSTADRIVGLLVCLTLMVGTGCKSRLDGPYSSQNQSSAVRDTPASDNYFKKAKDKLTSDPDEAEDLLRLALDKDLYNGPAHNNLGVLMLAKGNLYEATLEFEWARKLLPGHPDPRVNLAIALEAASKHTDAIEAARAALEVQPGNLPAIQALALIQVQAHLTDDKTADLLATIIERSSEPEWKEWAMNSKLHMEAKSNTP